MQKSGSCFFACLSFDFYRLSLVAVVHEFITVKWSVEYINQSASNHSHRLEDELE